MDVNQLKAENEFLKAEKKLSLQQLDKLNTKLTESEAFKSHFLSNISNEIINPFTSILGLSQNIIDLKSSDIKEIHEKRINHRIEREKRNKRRRKIRKAKGKKETRPAPGGCQASAYQNQRRYLDVAGCKSGWQDHRHGGIRRRLREGR